MHHRSLRLGQVDAAARRQPAARAEVRRRAARGRERADPEAGCGAQGLYTLFTHSGATLGLILGELLAEEIITGTPSPVLAPFTLDRFSDERERDEVGTGAWAPVR